MSDNKMFSYGLTFLLGAILAVAASLYWKGTDDSSMLETEYIADASLQKEDSHHGHHEHEEDIIKLSEEQIKKLGFQIDTAGPGNLSLTLSTRGKIILQPDRLVHIIPKVSGNVREAYKNIGNPVNANDLLAVLDSRDMADIKAAYLAALSKQRLTSSSLIREAKLYQDKVSAGQDYLNAKNINEEATINVQLFKQKLHAFGLDEEEIHQLANQSDPDLRLYQIRSPIDGTVILRHITKGEFVETTTTIYEIADLSTVWVEVGIYPKDLPRVKEGQMIEVVLPIENTKTEARLIYVSPIVADETITAKAVAELDNADGLWRPGVFVKVNIATEQFSRPLVIPKDAVQNIKGKDFAFVVVPEGFEKRSITVGSTDQHNAEVLSGLRAGEEYVANKTFLLKAELGKGEAEHEH